jgi:DNA-binding protein Fis
MMPTLSVAVRRFKEMNYGEIDATLEGRSETDANMKLHIEALRELAQAFIKEVEDLGAEQEPGSHEDLDFYDEVRRFEVNLICRALIRAGGQQNRAARLLGVKPTTLNSKIKRYQIEWDAPRTLQATLQAINHPTERFDENCMQGAGHHALAGSPG